MALGWDRASGNGDIISAEGCVSVGVVGGGSDANGCGEAVGVNAGPRGTSFTGVTAVDSVGEGGGDGAICADWLRVCAQAGGASPSLAVRAILCKVLRSRLSSTSSAAESDSRSALERVGK